MISPACSDRPANRPAPPPDRHANVPQRCPPAGRKSFETPITDPISAPNNAPATLNLPGHTRPTFEKQRHALASTGPENLSVPTLKNRCPTTPSVVKETDQPSSATQQRRPARKSRSKAKANRLRTDSRPTGAVRKKVAAARRKRQGAEHPGPSTLNVAWKHNEHRKSNAANRTLKSPQKGVGASPRHLLLGGAGSCPLSLHPLSYTNF